MFYVFTEKGKIKTEYYSESCILRPQVISERSTEEENNLSGGAHYNKFHITEDLTCELNKRVNATYRKIIQLAVADPGFPVGGAWTRWGGRGPPTWVLLGKNVCKNERIWSCRGGVRPARPPPPPRSANGWICIITTSFTA